MAKNMNNERKPDWDELKKIVAAKRAKAETVNRKAEASAPHQIIVQRLASEPDDNFFLPFPSFGS